MIGVVTWLVANVYRRREDGISGRSLREIQVTSTQNQIAAEMYSYTQIYNLKPLATATTIRLHHSVTVPA